MNKNLQIKITITDGEKEAKTTINVDDYKTIKELHGVSMLDDLVDVLLQDINKKQKVMSNIGKTIRDGYCNGFFGRDFDFYGSVIILD